MDGRQFVKMMKDVGFVDKKFTTTDVDLIFAKVKEKSQRKITFFEFEDALVLVAKRKGKTVDDLINLITVSKYNFFQVFI